MSKNKQILIFSGIGLAVLGGVTAVLLLTAPEEMPEEPETVIEETDERLILTDKTMADVTSVHVKNLSGEYDIIKTEEWTVKGLESANITISSLEAMVGTLSSMTAKQVVEENAADLSKYGLTAPSAEVTVYFGEESHTFLIGNEVPADSGAVYFSEKDKGTVYTFKSSDLTAFSSEKFDFIDRAAMPPYDQSTGEAVTKFTIERADLEEPIVIESLPEPGKDEIAVFSYELTSPFNVYVDLTNAPNFIYSLFGLTADKAVWYGMEEQDYELSGVNNPSCVFTLETTLKTYTVTLGNAVAKEVTDESGNVSTEIAGFYGMSSEVPDTLFLFSAESIPAFSIQAESIMSRLFLMPYIYSLETVEYSDKDGRSFNIGFETVKAETEDGQDKHSHYLNGELHEEQQVKNMYQFMISASGDELYTEEDGNGELLATVTYNYADKSEGSDVVKFYSSESDRKVIINVNGKNLYKTKQIYVNQLYKNAENFLKGEEIVLTY